MNFKALHTLAVLGLVVMLAFAGTPIASAQSASEDCGIVSDLFGGCDDATDDGWTASAYGYAIGHLDRLSYSVTSVFSSSYTSAAQDSADDVQTFFNNNSGDFVNYTNSRVTASEDYDVVRLTFEQDGDRVSKFLVMDVNSENGTYTSAEIVNETTQTPDSYVVINGYAAEDSAEELESFHSDYVSNDKTPKASYLARMYGKYGGDLSGPITHELDG